MLRRARREDGGELADFNERMHTEASLPAGAISEWTMDLFDVPHPTFRPDRDVTVVEDTTTGRIVSALFLIPQLWTYAGITVNVAQPELIATHPDYRRRGLVRAQFDVIHEWSSAAGHVWQFISGIPWYYRQFGYSYTIDLAPRPVLWFANAAPVSPPGLSVRPATADDLDFLAATEAEATSGTRLGPLRGHDGFALELARRPGGLLASEILIIQAGDQPIGYAAHPSRLPNGLVTVRAVELRRDTSWLAPTAALIAHLHGWASDHPDGPGRGIRWALPLDHPAIRCAATRVSAGPPGGYGLYVRVTDLATVVRAVTPVLDARLAVSPAVAWTGDLRLDLYDDGLQLHFDDGRLSSVQRWQPPAVESDGGADARLTNDTFLHLLLGNRPIAELERTTADCLLQTDPGALLLDVLFPPMPASTWEFC